MKLYLLISLQSRMDTCILKFEIIEGYYAFGNGSRMTLRKPAKWMRNQSYNAFSAIAFDNLPTALATI